MSSSCRVAALILGAGVLGGQPAAARDPMLPTTTAPIVYVINYSGDYFEKPDYIDRFRAAPPDMLHVGKAVPISHLWGPIRFYAGENQSTGGPGHTLSWENIALLAPDALEQRIDNIRRTLDRYHALGIREIVPYISYHTLAGDHEKRLGFWEFYDQWDKYARRAGPRPARDPFDWLVVDRSGRFVPGSCGGYSPDYYAPLHRYRACINHPDWAEWHRRLIRLVAEVGYDGCFVDNTHPDPCFCRHCKESFGRFLREERDADWVARLTKGLPPEKLALDSPEVPPELVRRWRLLCTARHLGMLRETGRRIKPGFTIFPNGNSLPECLLTGSQTDRLMFESTYSPGLVSEDPPACQTHMAALLFAQHMHARAICLGYEASKAGMENVQELALAETAAFSGGGGFSGQGAPQAKYRAFFKKHPELFAGWQPSAPAAVLFSGWGNNRLAHTRPVRQATIREHLAASQRLFTALVDTNLPEDAGQLAAFRTIYLESPGYDLSAGQLAALGDYARRGGKLVLAGPKTEINGQSAGGLLPRAGTAIWNPRQPVLSTDAVAPGDGPRRNLRFALYRQTDRLALHVVNYNVCLADKAKRTVNVAAVPLSVPLPPGWTAAGATCFDPDAEPRAVACDVAAACGRLTLPECRTYKIVLLERKR
jgi:hypothetical protein